MESKTKTKKCGRKAKAESKAAPCANTQCTGSCGEDKLKNSSESPESIVSRLIEEGTLTPEVLLKALGITGLNVDKLNQDSDEDSVEGSKFLDFEVEEDRAVVGGLYDGPSATSRVIDIEGAGQLIALPIDSEGSTAYFWVEGGKVTVPAKLADELADAATALGLELDVVGDVDDCKDITESDSREEELSDEFGDMLGELLGRLAYKKHRGSLDKAKIRRIGPITVVEY